ncbi:hypothetical protein BASA60_003413 [Batrachochytrium salamandrivorans]|nr:hypothetical protein BASA60_003413 [Batrachochytrium salamandrivorans]
MHLDRLTGRLLQNGPALNKRNVLRPLEQSCYCRWAVDADEQTTVESAVKISIQPVELRLASSLQALLLFGVYRNRCVIELNTQSFSEGFAHYKDSSIYLARLMGVDVKARYAATVLAEVVLCHQSWSSGQSVQAGTCRDSTRTDKRSPMWRWEYPNGLVKIRGC